MYLIKKFSMKDLAGDYLFHFHQETAERCLEFLRTAGSFLHSLARSIVKAAMGRMGHPRKLSEAEACLLQSRICAERSKSGISCTRLVATRYFHLSPLSLYNIFCCVKGAEDPFPKRST